MAKKENKAAEAVVGMSRGVKILIAVMVVVMVAAIAVAVWAIFFREDVILTPDYAPPEKEENAEKIEDDDKTKLETTEGGGAVEIQFTKEAIVDLSEKVAYIDVGNPSKSTQLMVIQVIVGETIIAQSGTLQPGYRVQKLDLLQDAEKILQEGGYDGKLKLLFYDEKTSERAIVDADLPMIINVQP